MFSNSSRYLSGKQIIEMFRIAPIMLLLFCAVVAGCSVPLNDAVQDAASPIDISIAIPISDDDFAEIEHENFQAQNVNFVNQLLDEENEQRINAWFMPKASPAYYDLKVESIDELEGLDWRIAQISDENQDNPWSTMIVRPDSDAELTRIIMVLEDIAPQLDGIEPNLLDVSEEIDPDSIRRFQITPDGQLVPFDAICPRCQPGPFCVRCPRRWCMLHTAQTFSVFVPGLNSEQANALQDRVNENIPEISIEIVTQLEPTIQVRGWYIPDSLASNYPLQVNQLPDLYSENYAGNWVVAAAQTDISNAQEMSVGIVRAGGTKNDDLLLQALGEISNALVEQDYVIQPSDLDVFMSYQISPEGLILPLDSQCETCLPLGN